MQTTCGSCLRDARPVADLSDQGPDSLGEALAVAVLPPSSSVLSGCQQGPGRPEGPWCQREGACCIPGLCSLLLQRVSPFLQSQNCLAFGAHLQPRQSDVSPGVAGLGSGRLGRDRLCPREASACPWGGGCVEGSAGLWPVLWVRAQEQNGNAATVFLGFARSCSTSAGLSSQ